MASKTKSDYDLEKYSLAGQLDRLQMLVEAWKATADETTRTFYEGQMIQITIDLDEHPEWFHHGCLCAECRSC